jgi:hypothetical protein
MAADMDLDQLITHLANTHLQPPSAPAPPPDAPATTHLQHDVAQLRQVVQFLFRQNSTLTAQLTQFNSTFPTLPLPDKYDGSRSKFKPFMTNLDIIFDLNGRTVDE